MNPGEVWVLIPLAVFAVPIVAIVTAHKRKMAELMVKGGGAEGSVLKELKELKDQFAELRDTTTRYDLSFDAALQRIESRVGHLENRVSSIEQSSTGRVSAS